MGEKQSPGFIGRVWCWITHRKHWEWYGHGDWRIQYCRKCGDKWIVPAEQARGQRR